MKFLLEKKRVRITFKYTKWYLKENYTDKKIDSILEFFKSYGLKCDCDIINKFDLREILDEKINFHN